MVVMVAYASFAGMALPPFTSIAKEGFFITGLTIKQCCCNDSVICIFSSLVAIITFCVIVFHVITTTHFVFVRLTKIVWRLFESKSKVKKCCFDLNVFHDPSQSI